MNVTCPNCATVYRVDPAKVPEGGVRARCAVCSAVFAVSRNGASPIEAQRGSTPVSQPVTLPPPAPPAAAPVAAAPPSPPPSAPAQPPPPAPMAPAAVAPSPAPASRPVQPPASPQSRPIAPSGPALVGGAPPRPAAPSRPQPTPPPSAAPAASRPGAAPTGPGGRPANPFLSQDPSLKAKRLARALVSDIVVYHPAKRQEGIRDGNLKELFEEEIKKSWEEYTEQVGREVAESTGFFREALNEILAGGRQIF